MRLDECSSVGGSAHAPPAPEFLEMIGRLAGAYCPTLLTTEVVTISRAALAGQRGDEMGEVEAVARAALDRAVAEPDSPSEVGRLPR